MKRVSSFLMKAFMAVTLCLLVVNCSKKEDDLGGEENESSITISNITPSYNSVTFYVKAEGANMISYLCDKTDTQYPPKEVFDNGTVVGSAEGTFTVRDLEDQSKYRLLVVSMGANGLSKIAKVEFETLENSGAPATPKSAGIRITKIEKQNVTLDVQNGSEVDFSYVSVWPTVYLENFLLDNVVGTSVTEEDFLKDLVGTSGYARVQIDGANTLRTGWDYASEMSDFLLPAADYTVLAVGVTVNGEEEVLNGLTRVTFNTESFERDGNPSVVIENPYTDYISAHYKFIPNADAAYFYRFATKTEEVDTFIKYFDEKSGVGTGKEKLRQLVRFLDILYYEHTDEMLESITYGWDQEGESFTMLALGADANLMPGDELARKEIVLTEKPANAEEAKFEMSVSDISATNAVLHFDLDDNCGRVYMQVVTPAQYEATLKNDGEVLYARTLWDSGWAIWRDKENNVVGKETFYYADLQPGVEYVIVATGLNYYGGLSHLKVSEPFTMLQHSFEGSEADADISMVATSKTMAKFHYKINEKATIIFHRILEADDPISSKSEEEITKSLIGNQGNMWAADDLNDGREYDYTWTGFDPGKIYTYFWVCEDGQGRISSLKRTDFRTSQSEGGPFPAVELSVTNISSKSATVGVSTNEDVASFLYFTFSNEELDAMTDDKEIAETLRDYLNANGLVSIDPFENFEMEIPEPNRYYYFCALPFGVDQVEGEVKFIKFMASDAPQSVAPKSGAAKVRTTRSSVSPKGVEALQNANGKLLKRLSANEETPQLYEPQMKAQDAREVLYLDMKALSKMFNVRK